MSFASDRLCTQTDGVSGTLKTVIVTTVLVVHVFLGFLPMLCSLYTPAAEKVYVDKVVLVDSAPNENTELSLNPGESPIPNNDPSPAPPEKLDPVPELEPIPKLEPVPQIEPEPAPTPVPPVERPVPKVEKVPDPKAPVIPVVKPKKQEKKKEPKKERKSLTVDDIRKNMTREKSPKRSSAHTRTPQRQGNRELQSLAEEIRGMKGGVAGGTGTRPAGGAGGSKGEYDPDRAKNSYLHNTVKPFLRARWTNKPNMSALGGQNPVVRVFFTIDGTGKILRAEMKPSGVAAMDSSVSYLLKTLNKLPPPPQRQGTTFWVDMSVY